MLEKFEVLNFKSFKDKLSFDLGSCSKYEYNTEAVNEGIVQKAIVYGRNGSGKSNLGLAIFDIVKNVTDFEFPRQYYAKNYAYVGTPSNPVEFTYLFRFGQNTLTYHYQKTNFETYIYEELTINHETVAKREKNQIDILTFKGTEHLSKNINNNKLSLIAYLKNNANLDKRIKNNKVFYQFIEYVENMLFFRSLDTREYIGYNKGSSNIILDIIKDKKVERLQSFFSAAGIEYKLKIEGDNIVCIFGKHTVPLVEIMSSGTITLLLLFYWLERLKTEKRASLIFIDEFDAFYHFELAKAIVQDLKTMTAQVILTTHNTSLLTNELLRPDCYFIIDSQKIASLPHLTDRELRAVHNLEKLYKAKAFD